MLSCHSSGSATVELELQGTVEKVESEIEMARSSNSGKNFRLGLVGIRRCWKPTGSCGWPMVGESKMRKRVGATTEQRQMGWWKECSHVVVIFVIQPQSQFTRRAFFSIFAVLQQRAGHVDALNAEHTTFAKSPFIVTAQR